MCVCVSEGGEGERREKKGEREREGGRERKPHNYSLACTQSLFLSSPECDVGMNTKYTCTLCYPAEV